MIYDYVIYTDGSYYQSVHKRPGGWGFIVYDKDDNFVNEECGGELYINSINTMELRALMETLNYLFINRLSNADVLIRPDSMTTIHMFNGMHMEGGMLEYNTSHVGTWISNGWKKLDGRNIPDLELVQLTHELMLKMFSLNTRIYFMHIMAHEGYPGNERADSLAKAGCVRNYYAKK